MSREVLESSRKERTTVCLNSVLLDRATTCAREKGISFSQFLSDALVNQLEKEGDFYIRDELKELEDL